MKPAEWCGEKVTNIVGYNKFNISTTTHQFQTIMSMFQRSTSVDALQLFDHCNTTSINDDMTILATHFQGRILVCHEKCHNTTTTDPFQSLRSDLERSTSVDTLQIVDYQNPTCIDENATICVSSNVKQFQNVILFGVTNSITPQQIVRFKPKDQRWKVISCSCDSNIWLSKSGRYWWRYNNSGQYQLDRVLHHHHCLL
jgi:hypothetical protein